MFWIVQFFWIGDWQRDTIFAGIKPSDRMEAKTATIFRRTHIYNTRTLQSETEQDFRYADRNRSVFGW